MNSDFVVEVRFPGERHYIREFVTPDAPDVLALVKSKPPDIDPISFFASWVWRHVNYPTAALPLAPDYHEVRAFRKAGWFAPAAIKLSTIDFWQFPSETLGWADAWGRHWGDCEDSSAVLCSLLRNYFRPEDVYVALGNVSILPHSWVRVRHLGKWQIIETTSPHRQGLAEDRPYSMKAYFNDRYATELERGFFSTLGAFASGSRRAHRAKTGVICQFFEECGLGVLTSRK